MRFDGLHNPAEFIKDLIARFLGRVDAHDDGVLKWRVANTPGQHVVNETIGRDKPGRGGAINEYQQYADKTEGDQSVPVFFSLFVQSQSSLHNAGSIENDKGY